MDYTNLNKDAIIDWLKTNLNEHRFHHSIGCAKTAVELAAKFGLNGEKAYIAGLLHDCAKNFPIEKSLEIIEKYMPEIDICEKENHKTIHAPASAYVAKSEFGIEDEEILSAIRWHTLGHLNMSKFEKIVFLADKIEPHTRDLDYRKKILSHLDEKDGIERALLVCYTETIESLTRRHLKICQITINVYNQLLDEVKHEI